MAGAGTIADEHPGPVNERKQLGDGVRARDRGFARFLPPAYLVGVARHLHGTPLFTQPPDDFLVTFQRPDAGGLPAPL